MIAKSFARIHWQNLVNFGILPLEFADPADYERVKQSDVLVLSNLRATLGGNRLVVENRSGSQRFETKHRFSERQVQVVLAGGLINWARMKLSTTTH